MRLQRFTKVLREMLKDLIGSPDPGCGDGEFMGFTEHNNAFDQEATRAVSKPEIPLDSLPPSISQGCFCKNWARPLDFSFSAPGVAPSAA
jgi:hypothetical protein